MPDSSIRPDVLAQFPSLACALHHGRELRAAHPGHHPSGAHRPGSHSHLDDIGSGSDEIQGSLCRYDVSCHDRGIAGRGPDFGQRLEHLGLMPVGCVDHDHVGPEVDGHFGSLRRVAIDPHCHGHLQSAMIIQGGIIHAGKIAVIADPEPPKSLLSIANDKADKVFILNQDYSCDRNLDGWWWTSTDKKLSDLPFSGLHGILQFNNLAGVLMSITALQDRLPISDVTIRTALPKVKLQGRFQVIAGRPLVILDVSHNPDSVALLAENLQQQDVAGKTHAVVAMLKDKDIVESLKNIISSIDYWYFAGLDVSRGENPEVLNAILKKLHPVGNSQVYADVNEAWDDALEQAGDDDRIVVFGSFHTVGVILERLNLNI